MSFLYERGPSRRQIEPRTIQTLRASVEEERGEGVAYMIQTQGLVKRYGKVVALDGLHLNVPTVPRRSHAAFKPQLTARVSD